MKNSALKLNVSSSIGEVSAEMYQPENMKAIFVFAHGAGAGMHHPFMVALIALNWPRLTLVLCDFNFPFTELQKKKRPDVPAVAHKTIEAAIQKTKELFPSTPLFARGKSFGGQNDFPVFSKAGF
jgi:predicted alpha/beta-hydrolase family hydrolase